MANLTFRSKSLYFWFFFRVLLNSEIIKTFSYIFHLLTQLISIWIYGVSINPVPLFSMDRSSFPKKVKVKSLSRLRLFVTPWTLAYQAPPSMGFSRQECWSRLPFPSPGIFPTQELNPGLPHCRQTLYHLTSF